MSIGPRGAAGHLESLQVGAFTLECTYITITTHELC